MLEDDALRGELVQAGRHDAGVVPRHVVVAYVELQTKVREDFTITEKASNSASPC